ncbi:MAG TPA: YcxB family protein [Humisphaera sp.]
MDPVQLHYTLTPADLDEWSRSAKPAKGGGVFGSKGGLVGWLVFIGLAMLLVNLVNNRNDPPATRPAAPAGDDLVGGILLPVVPWLVIFGFIWFFVYRQLRARGRRVWDANEDLRQPHVAVFDDLGVTVTGPKVSMRVLWSGFDAWSETANLLLLRQQPGNQFHIVPKRAVPTGQMEPLRALLHARVVPHAAGFPVVPSPPPEGRPS